MKKVLFLTDFSPNAHNALDYTIKYFHYHETRIDILHVVAPIMTSIGDVPTMSGTVTNDKLQVAKDIMKNLEVEVEKKLEDQEYSNLKMRTDVEIGTIVQVVGDKLDDDDYDILVMGTRGEKKSKLEKWIGTVSSDIIKNVRTPILLIPSDASWEAVKNVAFGSDLDDADPFELWRCLKVIQPRKPIVRWFHFNNGKSKQKDRMKELQEFYTDRAPNIQLTFHDVNGNSFEEAVEQFIDDYDIQILFLVKHKRSFFDNIFKKNHTGIMANTSEIPLLLIDSYDS